MVMVPSVLAVCSSAALAMRRRSRSVGRVARVAQFASAAAVLACPAVAVIQLALEPGGASAQPILGMLMAVVLAAEVGGYLWLVIRRPGPLGAWRHSGILGFGAAVALATVLFLANRQHGPTGDFAVTGVAKITAILAPLAAGAVAVILRLPHGAGIGHDLRIGAAECLWGALLSPPAVFLVDLLTTPDDLGRATITLTGFSLLFVLVLWVARDFRIGQGSLRTART
jgi:hypothetical protein